MMLLFFIVSLLSVSITGCGSGSSKDPDSETSISGVDTRNLSGEEMVGLKEEWERTWLAPEVRALKLEAALNTIWDASLDGADLWQLLADHAPQTTHLPKNIPGGMIEGDPQSRDLEPGGPVLSESEFVSRIKHWQAEGWEISQSEWRMPSTTFSESIPKSQVQLKLYLKQKTTGDRIFLQGRVSVSWKESSDASQEPLPVELKWISGYYAYSKGASTGFELAFDKTLDPVGSAAFADPVIFADLSSSGRDDALFAGANRMYSWSATEGFLESSILPIDALIELAAIADLNNDGALDLFAACGGSVLTFLGDGDGGFQIPPAVTVVQELRAPTAVAMTDLDGDGYQDVWISQYLGPFEGSGNPQPFDDADDGLPSFLFKNNQDGTFTDVTEGSGLDVNRKRRNYTGAFLDFDGDQKVDFIQVNDFDGLDYFQGIGGGQFELKTDSILGETRGFGMSHQIADFNGDQRPDIFMVGMTSATASRMDSLDVSHPDFPAIKSSRSEMTYGNRVWINQIGKKWNIPDWAESLRDTGWAWGNVYEDFDNDGVNEFYVANGHMSNRQTKDLEGDFWRYEVYMSGYMSKAFEQHMKDRAARLVSDSLSIGGHHRNALMKRTAQGWRDLAWLDGIALTEDCLNTASWDYDQDGLMDLLVISKEPKPSSSFRLRIFHNIHENQHWIGIRVPYSGSRAPWGCRVDLKIEGGETRSHWVVLQQGFRTQPAAIAHFGLGSQSKIESVKVTWPDGQSSLVKAPSVDQWMTLPLP